MNPQLGERALIAIAVVYLGVLSWSMANLSYDIWGVLVVAPPLGVAAIWIVRKLFGRTAPELVLVLCLGLVVKLAGTAARYWVAFDAYSGATDAQSYHLYAVGASRSVWNGSSSFWSVLPGGTGTEFTERFTALVYTVSGTSKLGAYVVFAWLSYVGTLFFVKAASVAVPNLALKRSLLTAEGLTVTPRRVRHFADVRWP